MQRVLVIDDDPSITSALRRGLGYQGFAVETALSGSEGLALARQQPPDAVLLDVMMPGMDGYEVLCRLRAGDQQLRVLMVTAKDTPIDQVQGLECGADDYVIKPFTFDILVARIRALLRRQEGDHPSVLHLADLSLDVGTHRAQRGSRCIDLTSTEYDLLHEFLRHPRRVLTKEGLMERIWGYDFGGNANILEVYVKQLRQKLEAAGEARLIYTLRGTGYVLRES